MSRCDNVIHSIIGSSKGSSRNLEGEAGVMGDNGACEMAREVRW